MKDIGWRHYCVGEMVPGSNEVPIRPGHKRDCEACAKFRAPRFPAPRTDKEGGGKP